MIQMRALLSDNLMQRINRLINPNLAAGDYSNDEETINDGERENEREREKYDKTNTKNASMICLARLLLKSSNDTDGRINE